MEWSLDSAPGVRGKSALVVRDLMPICPKRDLLKCYSTEYSPKPVPQFYQSQFPFFMLLIPIWELSMAMLKYFHFQIPFSCPSLLWPPNLLSQSQFPVIAYSQYYANSSPAVGTACLPKLLCSLHFPVSDKQSPGLLSTSSSTSCASLYFLVPVINSRFSITQSLCLGTALSYVLAAALQFLPPSFVSSLP